MGRRRAEGRHRCWGEVAIELKWELTSVAEMERTKGQLHTYVQEFDHTFLVLCGATDAHLAHVLRKYAQELTDQGWSGLDHVVEVIMK